MTYFLAILFLCGLLLWWQLMAYKAPEPAYKLLNKDGSFETRQYPFMLLAEVQIEGTRRQAIQDGFKILADYIFGNNQPQNSISMTAPVMQQGASMAMTAPVLQQNENGLWKIQFIMPSTYTLNNIPKPNNSAIKLIEIPSRKCACLCFTGENSSDNLNKHLALLNQHLQKHKLNTIGQPQFAFYNPPWILPFLRRNEIIIEIASS